MQLSPLEEPMMKNILRLRSGASRMHLTAAHAAFALTIALALAVVTTAPAQAQTFMVLDNFNGTNGGGASASLLQATNGNLYGTTAEGGAAGAGNVFEVTPSGTLTSIYAFCLQGTPPSDCPDGYRPVAPLIQASNGDLYGTTEEGGANRDGTVFKITPSGTLTTLYSFCSLSGCADGQNP
jgi:uncharacterized repeat protein (TIGR03803 family)